MLVKDFKQLSDAQYAKFEVLDAITQHIGRCGLKGTDVLDSWAADVALAVTEQDRDPDCDRITTLAGDVAYYVDRHGMHEATPDEDGNPDHLIEMIHEQYLWIMSMLEDEQLPELRRLWIDMAHDAWEGDAFALYGYKYEEKND